MGCNIFSEFEQRKRIFLQIIKLFKVISLEGWTDVMYIIQDVHSFYNFVYFVVLIIVRIEVNNEFHK